MEMCVSRLVGKTQLRQLPQIDFQSTTEKDEAPDKCQAAHRQDEKKNVQTDKDEMSSWLMHALSIIMTAW